MGPLLFIMSIRDLDVGVGSSASNFADDTERGRIVNSFDDSRRLQEDHNRL